MTAATLAAAVACYLAVGAIGLALAVRFAFSPGERLIEPGLGVPGNALVLTVMTIAMPLLFAAAPFAMLWWLIFPGRTIPTPARVEAPPKLPPGVLRCLPPCGCRRKPFTAVDPVELPAFLRRQLEPSPPRGLHWRWWR